MSTGPIVVGYDGSTDAEVALAWALDEAVRTGTRVHLVHGFEWFPGPVWMSPGPTSWPDSQARQIAAGTLAAAIESAGRTHPDVPVTSAVLDGSPVATLLEASHKAALVVVGSRGEGGFAELLIGSTAVTVSAHASCPVVVVRGEPTSMADAGVVVGVDGSACAQLALGFALEQAASRQVPLRVIRTWLPPLPRFVPPDLDADVITRATRQELDELVDGYRAKFPDVAVTTEVHAEPAAGVLVEASRTARLVVVGSRGRGALRGTVLGSVSQQLIHHSHSPVAVVREVGRPAGADPC